jgi:hypothetical protein
VCVGLPSGSSGVPIAIVRRLFSILLLLVFGLPSVTPLLALTAGSEASLPACCRRSGKHQCAMNAELAAKLSQSSTVLRAPVEKCPSYPAALVVNARIQLAAPISEVVYAELVAHPACVAQTESKLRISIARTRQERGPPASL